MANYNDAFKKLIANEGGYANDPDDSGGETYRGISRNNWPEWAGWAIIDSLNIVSGVKADIILGTNGTLTISVASFYKENFWNKLRADEILLQEIAEAIFDFAVNAGLRTTVKMVQGLLYVDQDGHLGPITLDAFDGIRSELFLERFALEKIKRYHSITVKKPSQRKYFYGWVSRALRHL